MDQERTPDDVAVDHPARSRPAPEPRTGDAVADTPSPALRSASPAAGETAQIPPITAPPLPPSFPPTLPTGDPLPSAEPTVPTNIYRARRPAAAALLIVPAVAVGILLVRALAVSAFGGPFLIGGVIASSLALASLPLLVTGLYGLVTGAAHGAEQWGFKVWARPPLAYLVVAFVFVIAAAVAAP